MIKLKNLFHKKFEREHVAVSESDKLSQDLDSINKCYLKFRASDVKCAGSVDLLRSLEDAISQCAVFAGNVDSLIKIVEVSVTGQARVMCSSTLVRLVGSFNENVKKIASLSDYFYRLYDYRNSEELQKECDKAAENMRRLVSENWRICNVVSELYISLNDSNADYNEIAGVFYIRSKKI